MKFVLLIISCFGFGIAACTQSDSNSAPPSVTVRTTDDSKTTTTESSSHSSNETIELGEPHRDQSTKPVVLLPAVLVEIQDQGIKVIPASGDDGANKLADLIIPLKETILKNKELFENVSSNQFFEYDAIKKSLRLSEDPRSNQLELQTILSMAAYGKSLGAIAIDTPGLIPHLAWPLLKAKIDPFKDKIKARSKYIRHITSTNIGDNFFAATRTLEVNEEADAAALERAIKQVDQSKGFLDQLPDIRLILNPGTMSVDFDRHYESLQLLTPSLVALGQTMVKHQIKNLRIDDSLGLGCKFRASAQNQMIDIYAFTSDQVKNGSCSPSQLIKLIDETLNFQAEMNVNLSEEYNIMGPIVVLGPSVEGFKEILSLKKAIEEKTEKIKEVRIQADDENGALCRLRGTILLISKPSFDVHSTAACVEAL